VFTPRTFVFLITADLNSAHSIRLFQDQISQRRAYANRLVVAPWKECKGRRALVQLSFPTFSGLGFTLVSNFLKFEPGELEAPRGTYEEGEREMKACQNSAKVTFCQM
jgi:hypothetical protein